MVYVDIDFSQTPNGDVKSLDDKGTVQYTLPMLFVKSI